MKLRLVQLQKKVKHKNQDIKKLKFYFIKGAFQCSNCKGFHWHVSFSEQSFISIECKCHCHLRWNMFEDRSALEHLLEFPPNKCKKNCIVCRYMQNKKTITKIEDFF